MNGELPRQVEIVRPGDPFNHELYLEPGVSNLKIDQGIEEFMWSKRWTIEQIVDCYKEKHPCVDKSVLQELLVQASSHIHSAGMDFIYAVNEQSKEAEFVLIEPNVLAQREKAMPPSAQAYERLLHSSFFSREKEWSLTKGEGGLAFLYGPYLLDNPVYPHFMAEISQEIVYTVPLSSHYDRAAVLSEQTLEGDQQLMKFENGIMYVLYEGAWAPIRACFCKQSDKPWFFIPISTKTFMYPPAIASLAGGKNKHLAQIAYEDFNRKYAQFGLTIRAPKTITGIQKDGIQACRAEHFPGSGGVIVKTPYDCQGRGVFVITSDEDEEEFAQLDLTKYSLFIVQDLVLAAAAVAGQQQLQEASRPATPASDDNRYSFFGYSAPDGNTYSATFRLIICDATDGSGFKLISACAVRAPKPYASTDGGGKGNSAASGASNNDIYITNTAGKLAATNRNIHMDEESVRRLGFKLADFVDAYVQSVLALLAIDDMCTRLLTKKSNNSSGGGHGHGVQLDWDLLIKLNPDCHFISEVMQGQQGGVSYKNGL